MVCFFLGDRNALFYKYFIKHLLKRLCRAGCDIKATVLFRVLEANIINMFNARPGRTDQISINNQRPWTLCVRRCSLGLKTNESLMVHNGACLSLINQGKQWSLMRNTQEDVDHNNYISKSEKYISSAHSPSKLATVTG
jgi:hypothetical protein